MTDEPVLGGGLDDGLDDWLEGLFESLPPGLPPWHARLVDDLSAALDRADSGEGGELEAARAAVLAAAGAGIVPRALSRRDDWRVAFLCLLAWDTVHELEGTGAEHLADAREQLALDLAFLRDDLPAAPGTDLSARKRLAESSPSLLRFATVIVLADLLTHGKRDDARGSGTGEPLHEADDGKPWAPEPADSGIAKSYRTYEREAIDRYKAFFAGHPELRDPEHSYKALSLAAALPAGWGHLEKHLPPRERHRHALSGRSSQVVALGLLGAGLELDPTLAWLGRALKLPEVEAADSPRASFEWRVPYSLLREAPRPTSIDFLVETEALVLCLEAKWTERGFGICSCAPRAIESGPCRPGVLQRSAYWQVLGQDFGQPLRHDGAPCPLSPLYQQVRNVAAARALAESTGRTPAVAVLYDDRNPMFSDERADVGGLPALQKMLAASDVIFTATSWQRLMDHLPDDAAVRDWARERHGL